MLSDVCLAAFKSTTFIALERWKKIAFYKIIFFTLSSRLPNQLLILGLSALTGQAER